MSPTQLNEAFANAVAEKPAQVTDYQGNRYNVDDLSALANQIAANTGSLAGGAFGTSGESIGFGASDLAAALGAQNLSAADQVVYDMARQLMQQGITDIGQIRPQDITTSNNIVLTQSSGSSVIDSLRYEDPDTGQIITRQLTPAEQASIQYGIAEDGSTTAYLPGALVS